MESLVNVFERCRGKMIELATNGGQKLTGIVEEVHEDFFTLSSVTRVYVVPYTGISTFHLPFEGSEARLRQRATLITETDTSVGRTRRKASERKAVKRTQR
jgi:hypothetical protein